MVKKKKGAAAMQGNDPILVGERILLFRNAQSQNQRQMAHFLDLGPNGYTTVSKWERGEAVPSLKVLHRFEAAYPGEVFMEWISTGAIARMSKEMLDRIYAGKKRAGAVEGGTNPFPMESQAAY